MNKIVINGKEISFNGTGNVCIQGDKVSIDGKLCNVESKHEINIVGDVGSIVCDCSVQVSGDIAGNVNAGGSVQCRNIGKGIDAGGSVRANVVGGNIDAPVPDCNIMSVEDITEVAMGVEMPQRSTRRTDMFNVATEYYKLLYSTEYTSDSDKKVLKDKLDELSIPFSDNQAFIAFLNMERVAKFKE